MKLAAPLIIAAHVQRLPSLPAWAAVDGGRPGVAVYEGAALRRDDVREWITVGFVAGAAEPTISLEPVPAAQGAQNREAGTIVSQLVVAAADVATARGRVFDLIGEWTAWLIGDRTLADDAGNGRLLGNSDVHVRADVTLATTRNGATGNALVTVTYSAATYG